MGTVIPLHRESSPAPDLSLALERFLLERRGLDLPRATMAFYTTVLQLAGLASA